MLSWGPIRLAGLYVLDYQTPGSDEVKQRALAVNLLSEAEANAAALENLEIGQVSVSATSREAASYTPLWPFAVGFCLAVLLLEWWVYHKKMFV